jgi:hypothetical protein
MDLLIVLAVLILLVAIVTALWAGSLVKHMRIEAPPKQQDVDLEIRVEGGFGFRGCFDFNRRFPTRIRLPRYIYGRDGTKHQIPTIEVAFKAEGASGDELEVPLRRRKWRFRDEVPQDCALSWGHWLYRYDIRRNTSITYFAPIALLVRLWVLFKFQSLYRLFRPREWETRFDEADRAGYRRGLADATDCHNRKAEILARSATKTPNGEEARR